MTFSVLPVISVLTLGSLFFFLSGQKFHFLFLFLKQLKIVEDYGWKGS